MQKRGVQFVTSTVVVFVVLLIAAALLIAMLGKSASNTNQKTSCSGQGYDCAVSCGGDIPLPFDCPVPGQQCCNRPSS